MERNNWLDYVLMGFIVFLLLKACELIENNLADESPVFVEPLKEGE